MKSIVLPLYPRLRFPNLVCVVLLAVLASCGGGRNATPPLSDSKTDGLPAQPANPGAQPALPGMAELIATKAGSLVDADRYATGSLFKATLPNTNTQVNGTALTFMPTWNPAGGHDHTQAALAVYEFPLSGMTGAQNLTLSWATAPNDYGNLFIGLSNFNKNRWEWIQGSAAPIALPDIAPYQAADGRVFVAVMLLGLQNAELAWIRIGGNILPTAMLTAVSDTGATPFTAQFDAGASSDLDGTIVSYDYDFENDGGFELTGATAQEAHLYTAEGDYTCAVRVTDSDGGQATATFDVHAVAPGAGPTAVLAVDYAFHDAPYNAQLDASGSSAPNGIGKYEWDLDNDGSYETDSGLTPTQSWPIPGAGTFTAGLKVTDGIGLTSTATITSQGDVDGYDEVENNDDFATADAIPALNFSGFEGNLGDPGDSSGYDNDKDDWFAIPITGPTDLTLTMHYTYADADLDMKLMDVNGTSQLDSAASSDDDDSLSYTFTVPGTYFLHCYWFSGSTGLNADYTLEFRRLVSPTVSLGAIPTSGAAPLSVGFTATANDPDGTIARYEWDFGGDGNYEYNSGTAPTAVHVYNASGTHNATVKVTDNDGASSTSMVPITVTVTYDEVEPDDAFSDAQLLPAADSDRFFGNIGAGGPVDGDESDWYKFTGTAGQEIGTILTFDNNGANLKLALYELDGSTLIMDSEYGTTDDDEFVMFTPAANGTYFLNVTCPAGANSTDYVLSQYTYTLNEVEPNEDGNSGTPLPASPFVKFGGQLENHGASREPYDYYQVIIPAPGTHTIWLRFVDNEVDVDMELYDVPDESAPRVAYSTNTDSDERLTYAFLTAGNYYLRVYNYADGPDADGSIDYIIQMQ
jgi:hypothetical protein